MLGKTYDTQTCSIARALELVGERWTLLIMRDAVLAGLTRFTDFQRSLGIATNVLDERLSRLVEAGILRKRRYADIPELHEYLVTPKGRKLLPALLALSDWGDRWAGPDGAPMVYRRADCGAVAHVEIRCEHGDRVEAVTELAIETGPGMTPSRIETMTAIFANRADDPRLAPAFP